MHARMVLVYRAVHLVLLKHSILVCSVKGKRLDWILRVLSAKNKTQREFFFFHLKYKKELLFGFVFKAG